MYSTEHDYEHLTTDQYNELIKTNSKEDIYGFISRNAWSYDEGLFDDLPNKKPYATKQQIDELLLSGNYTAEQISEEFKNLGFANNEKSLKIDEARAAKLDVTKSIRSGIELSSIISNAKNNKLKIDEKTIRNIATTHASKYFDGISEHGIKRNVSQLKGINPALPDNPEHRKESTREAIKANDALEKVFDTIGDNYDDAPDIVKKNISKIDYRKYFNTYKMTQAKDVKELTEEQRAMLDEQQGWLERLWNHMWWRDDNDKLNAFQKVTNKAGSKEILRAINHVRNIHTRNNFLNVFNSSEKERKDLEATLKKFAEPFGFDEIEISPHSGKIFLKSGDITYELKDTPWLEDMLERTLDNKWTIGLGTGASVALYAKNRKNLKAGKYKNGGWGSVKRGGLAGVAIGGASSIASLLDSSDAEEATGIELSKEEKIRRLYQEGIIGIAGEAIGSAVSKGIGIFSLKNLKDFAKMRAGGSTARFENKYAGNAENATSMTNKFLSNKEEVPEKIIQAPDDLLGKLSHYSKKILGDGLTPNEIRILSVAANNEMLSKNFPKDLESSLKIKDYLIQLKKEAQEAVEHGKLNLEDLKWMMEQERQIEHNLYKTGMNSIAKEIGDNTFDLSKITKSIDKDTKEFLNRNGISIPKQISKFGSRESEILNALGFKITTIQPATFSDAINLRRSISDWQGKNLKEYGSAIDHHITAAASAMRNAIDEAIEKKLSKEQFEKYKNINNHYADFKAREHSDFAKKIRNMDRHKDDTNIDDFMDKMLSKDFANTQNGLSGTIFTQPKNLEKIQNGMLYTVFKNAEGQYGIIDVNKALEGLEKILSMKDLQPKVREAATLLYKYIEADRYLENFMGRDMIKGESVKGISGEITTLFHTKTINTIADYFWRIIPWRGDKASQADAVISALSNLKNPIKFARFRNAIKANSPEEAIRILRKNEDIKLDLPNWFNTNMLRTDRDD